MDVSIAKQFNNLRRRVPGRRSVLLALVASLLGGCGMVPMRKRAGDGATPHSARDARQIEREVFERVNAYRRSRGLPALAADPRMRDLAWSHSRRMASRGRLSHRGSGKRFENLQPSGVVAFAENVAYNLGHGDPAGTAVAGWIRSRGHHRNMTHPEYQLTGVGVAYAPDGGCYFTQLFGRRQ